MPQSGFLMVQGSNKKATYRVGDVKRAAYASTQTMWQLKGAAGKSIRLLRVVLKGRATAGAELDITLIKRTTLNAGGTATTLNAAYDTADGAPSGVAQVFTAVPTAFGTVQGTVEADMLVLQTAGTADTLNNGITWDYTGLTASEVKPIQLEGATESLEINFGTWTTAAGNAFDFTMAWLEEGAVSQV